MESILDLEQLLSSLPKGYISKKVINGKERFYLQSRQGSKIKSEYIPSGQVEELREKLAKRKEIEEKIASIYRSAPSFLVPSLTAQSLTGSVMEGDEAVATFVNGVITYIDEKKAPMLLCRVHDLRGWLENRAIDSHRTNSRLLKRALRLKDHSDLSSALASHAATITDDYWFKAAKSKLKYADIRFNNDAYAYVALKGDSLLAPKKPLSTPELTQRGSFEKCWRIIEGRWTMVKSGSPMELFSEWFCSELAKKLGIPTAEYRIEGDCILTDNFAADANLEPMSSLTGEDDDYEAVFPAVYRLSAELAKQYLLLMWFDCLIYNVDRHSENMGFLRNRRNGKIISLAPNYDNNLALFSRGMPKDPYRKKDGMISLFLKFLSSSDEAKRIYVSIALPQLSKKDFDEIISRSPVEVDEDFLWQFLENGYLQLDNKLLM